MSGRFPLLDRAQVEAILQKAGFSPDRQKGSHVQWVAYINGVKRTVTVDDLGGRKKEKYGQNLLGKMIEQSGLSKKKFYSYLGK